MRMSHFQGLRRSRAGHADGWDGPLDQSCAASAVPWMTQSTEHSIPTGHAIAIHQDSSMQLTPVCSPRRKAALPAFF